MKNRKRISNKKTSNKIQLKGNKKSENNKIIKINVKPEDKIELEGNKKSKFSRRILGIIGIILGIIGVAVTYSPNENIQNNETHELELDREKQLLQKENVIEKIESNSLFYNASIEKDTLEAINLYTDALTKLEIEIYLYTQNRDIWSKSGDEVKAQEYNNKVDILKFISSCGYKNRGALYYRLGKYDKAHIDMDRAVKINQ